MIQQSCNHGTQTKDNEGCDSLISQFVSADKKPHRGSELFIAADSLPPVVQQEKRNTGAENAGVRVL